MSGVKKVFKKVKGKLYREKKPSDVPTELTELTELEEEQDAQQYGIQRKDISNGSAPAQSEVLSGLPNGTTDVPAANPIPAVSSVVEDGPLTDQLAEKLVGHPPASSSQEDSLKTGKLLPVDADASSAPSATAAAPAVAATPQSEPWVTLELKHFWYGFLAVVCIFLAFGLALERPSIWEFLLGIVLFTPLGFLHAYLSKRNEIKKMESNYLLRVNPGIKGLNYLLGSVPTWVSFKEKEKAEVLNAIIREMWPYLDKAVANSIKGMVEPMLVQNKPPGISKIYFKDFTFGGAPIELDNIWVDKDITDKLVMEVDVRWSADTSNIALAVNTVGAIAGAAPLRLVVRVTDIAIAGTCRLTFQPLIDEYPGFGAMTVALIGFPILRYTPNFGKLGGSVAAKGVQLWLDRMIRQNIIGALVWPQRLVIPIFTEDITGPLDDLYLRHKGTLKVEFIEGKNLKIMDVFSKSDPFVAAWTNNQFIETTRVITNSIDPKWNETKWFLIQEPETQSLYLTVFDHDILAAKDLFKFSAHRDPTTGSRELMGRCKVPLKEITANPGMTFKKELELGREEFSNLEGCGAGEGTITITLCYQPLSSLDPANATTGLLQLTLVKANNLPNESENDAPDPYFMFKVKGREDKRSTVVMDSRDPAWVDEKFEFMMVHREDEIEVILMDRDAFTNDETVGSLVKKVKDFAPVGDYLIILDKKYKKKKVLLAEGDPTVTLKALWIPFE